MLNAAITNTLIKSQNTMPPTIAGTGRRMPTSCMLLARPLRSAAVCRPIFSLTTAIRPPTQRAST
jgi:hypothetical protein